MDSKYLVIGGIALLAIILVAGIIFSPSGFLTKPGAAAEYVCVKANTNYERCDGSGDNFWKENSWKSGMLCEEIVDSESRTCGGYSGCKCKQLSE